ncbi:hypothetical protein D3C76_727160 [compost metagenome]
MMAYCALQDMVRLELNVALRRHNPAVALTLANRFKHIIGARDDAADNITTAIYLNRIDPNHVSPTSINRSDFNKGVPRR